MKYTQAFKMAVKSILARKGRTALTMLGMVIGVAAVIIMVSLQQAQTDYWMDYIRKMGTNRIDVYCDIWSGGRSVDISRDIYNYCLSMTDLVSGVTPSQVYWDGRLKYQSKTMQGRLYFGSDQYSICANNTIARGRDLAYMDIEQRNRVCVIGSAIVEKFFNYKNPIGEILYVNNEQFTIVGTYEQKYDGTEWSDDNIVLVPYTLNRTLMKSTAVNQFIVKAVDAESTQKAIDELNIFLLTKTRAYPNNAWFNVSSTNQMMEEGDQQERQSMLMMGGIAAISLLVGGIGIMNIMLVTVRERTREIGVRKAIGAERSSIIVQFLVESGMVSAMGGLIGVVLGILGTMVWIKLSQDILFLPTLFIMLLAFGISVALGILFGIYPAAKASRLQPVDALRNE